MSTDILPFHFEAQQVRVIDIDGAPWFVLKDLCDILQINNSRMVTQRLDEGCVSQADVTDSLGRERQTTVVNEAGMYEVVIRSDSPIAKPFRRWVTSEVLPSIRKTGQYGATPQLSGPELYLAAITQATKEIEAQKTRIAELEPKAAFADAVATSHTSILVGDLAKILKGNGLTGSGLCSECVVDTVLALVVDAPEQLEERTKKALGNVYESSESGRYLIALGATIASTCADTMFEELADQISALVNNPEPAPRGAGKKDDGGPLGPGLTPVDASTGKPEWEPEPERKANLWMPFAPGEVWEIRVKGKLQDEPEYAVATRGGFYCQHGYIPEEEILHAKWVEAS